MNIDDICIAIADTGKGFSTRWIEYCQEKGIQYRKVNPYSSDLIDKIKGCSAFMWHHSHGNYKDLLFAKQLLFALEHSGMVVFPSFFSGWHFDDKLGQKYLMEIFNIKSPKAWVFYDRKSALNWLRNTSYPKVFKLRGGAGSSNVKLIKSYQSGKKIISKAFNRGFSSSNSIYSAKTQWTLFKKKKTSFYNVAKYIGLFLFPTYFKVNLLPKHKGYVYFQEYIPNNGYDIRVIIVGDKAFAIRRNVRKNDFRASGSGDILYDKTLFDEKLISHSFDINNYIKSDSLVLDYVLNKDTSEWFLIEISYGFSAQGYEMCPGFWTSDMMWHPGFFDSRDWMVQIIIDRLLNREE